VKDYVVGPIALWAGIILLVVVVLFIAAHIVSPCCWPHLH
jgi:hypothetical protein